MNYIPGSIDEQGRMFLSDRGLSYKIAEKMGVSSSKGDIAFPYYLNGQLIRVKLRSMTDKKKQRMNSLSDAEKSVIKMPFWNQRDWATRDHLVITEGEPDCIALTQLGANNVVSLPNGSNSVISAFKNNYDYLQKFDLIYIAFDMDASGEAAAEEARKLLPVHKYRRIKFPHKDANDWIREDPTVDQAAFEELKLLATKICSDELIPMEDLPHDFFLPRSLGVLSGWKPLDLIIGGIRSKELTVISGDTGCGKTTFALNLLCNLVSRTLSRFWVNSWEMHHEVIVRKIASVVLESRFKNEGFTPEQSSKFLQWIRSGKGVINPNRTRADIDTLRKQIDLAVRIYGVKFILLDHLDYIVSTSKERDSVKKLEESMSAIHEMAMEFDVHIFLIAHAKQIDSPDGRMHMGQLKGGAAIKQYADNIWLLLNKAQADANDNRMEISVEKNRFLGKRGRVTLRYLPERDSYVSNSDIFTP